MILQTGLRTDIPAFYTPWFLNRLTEEATGKQVIALPIEATALGNLKIQMEVK